MSRFVVQLHDATRLHFDPVEDHSLAAGDVEGVGPPRETQGGTAMSDGTTRSGSCESDRTY